MFTWTLIHLLIELWLFGALVDLAYRAPMVVDGTDAFGNATASLLWPIYRPITVTSAVWNKLFG